MYQPPHFREDRLEIQHGLIKAHPLGLLISTGADGPVANAIPFLIDPNASPKGTLRGHLARANPQWRDLEKDGRVLVVFQGAQTYVTPSWYATKRETGKVVPTWNYAIVQVRGTARIIDDRAWLASQVASLTGHNEAPRAAPWTVDDAPPTYIDAQLKGIIGIEIEIIEIEGKWKVSQNRPESDRTGVADGLETDQHTAEALAMAEMVRRGGATN
ncbi:FMN-binding negative transcriptional regulator [Phyllobacterium zundukense]|uniref:Transcriptional regulator n=1 Tax=Phyllobacterium zundukense TaxID=1867719 RepID=A0A2N9W4G0_9HYPH|nr:FMN-binding negative transcriptional regulator [Phyllobacterium zundukense]ATU91903.1 transcriptional regulator [Phyllobacterium zundukense]PIO46628.1 transcriptional regulator [Phyllobacterium zundukense]